MSTHGSERDYFPVAFERKTAVDVVVVGAGAAGLTTAIFARRRNASRRVVVLEGARRLGAKILVSGGSRCNVTNVSVGADDFWGGPSTIVRRILRAFPVADTRAFFSEIGIALREEAGGKLFPVSNRSRDVLDALVAEAHRVGVDICVGARVTDVVVIGEGGFRVQCGRDVIAARSVVLATGGRSLPKTGSDGFGFELARRLGHTLVPTTPGLAPLVLPADEPLHRTLAGVSQDVELTIWIEGRAAIRLRDSLLWTHFGVSGPVALNASRHWLRAELEGRRVSATLNFCEGWTFDRVDERWIAWTRERPRLTLQNALASIVPASLASALLAALAIEPTCELAHLSRDDRRRLVHALVAWPLPVAGSRGYTFAEVTAGGVALTEIDPATMASRRCKGLSLVGEILDVDGRIGGFNFQWAWATGYVAGTALAN